MRVKVTITVERDGDELEVEATCDVEGERVDIRSHRPTIALDDLDEEAIADEARIAAVEVRAEAEENAIDAYLEDRAIYGYDD